MTDLEIKLQKDLNEQQYNAAIHMKDPAVIVAGAGSGKTHTLISRIEHLVDEGADPNRIVMLTFTNSAADEMKYRASQVNEECKKVLATTYHKYCSLILRKYGSVLGIEPSFETLTPAKYKTLIEYVKSSNDKYEQLKGFPSAARLDTLFSVLVNCGTPLRDLITGLPFECYYDEIKDLFNEVKAYGLKNQQLNFDDLLVYMNKLLNMPDVCEKIANTFDYLMVDEFQDTNTLQLDILTKLGQYNKNIVVVGDISQSIYKFRGAKATNITSFVKFFNPTIYTLTLNYRSTQEILDAANDIMNKNVSTWNYVDMVADNKNGAKPTIVYHNDTYSQADWLIDTISEFQLQGIELKDIAVIERKSMSSFKLENELTKFKIPFEKRGGMKFTDYQCIDDVISFMSIVINKSNKFEWFNVLKLIPGIGNKAATDISESIDDLEKFSKKKYYIELMDLMNMLEEWKNHSNLSELFDNIVPYYFDLRDYKIDQSKNMSSSAKYDAKDKIKRDKKVIEVLRDMASDYDSVREFLEDIALDTIKSKEPEPGDRLVITTIHSAKGLEWKVVILLDCIEYDMTEDFEEELRCWYVAMTRAKDELILSVPRNIVQAGQSIRVDVNQVVQTSKKYFNISY